MTGGIMPNMDGIDPVITRFAQFVPRDLAREIIEARKRQIKKDLKAASWRDWLGSLAYVFHVLMENWPPRLFVPVRPPSWVEQLQTCSDPTDELVQALALQFAWAWLMYLSETVQLTRRSVDERGISLDDDDLFPTRTPDGFQAAELRPIGYLRHWTEYVAGEETIGRLLDGFARNVRTDFNGRNEDVAYERVIIRARDGSFTIFPASA